MRHNRARRAVAVAAAVAASTAVTVLCATSALATTPTSPALTWATNGRVSTILPVGDRVYVGGSFTAVTDPSGHSYPVSNLAVFTASTGKFDLSWTASANSAVTSLATDGTSIYIGGGFSSVDNVTRGKLAALDPATGALNTAWHPSLDLTPDKVAVSAGNLYVGGQFTKVTSTSGVVSSRAYVARISTSTGNLDTTWAPTPSARVRALVPNADGSAVYIAGEFNSVSGNTLANSEARITSAGTVDPSFKPGFNNGNTHSPVLDMDYDAASNRVVLAVAGGNGACTAQDGAGGTTLWSKHANGDVQAVRVSSGLVVCGGHFDGTGGFDGLYRKKLASVDLLSGTTQPFAPVVNSSLGVWAIGMDGTSRIYAGGDFTKLGETLQAHFAEFVDTTAQTAPAAPEGLQAIASDTKVIVSWYPPSTDGGTAVTTYTVYRNDGTTGFVQVGTPTSASYTDLKVTNGVTYQYMVSASNVVGEGAQTGPVSATPVAETVTVPGTPTAFTVTGVHAANSLTWNAPNDGGSAITFYQVYRGTSPAAETLFTTVNTPATSYSDTAVTVGTRYYYRISAVNAVGEGSLSVEQAGVPSNGAPKAPVLSGSATTGRVALNWTVPSNSGSPITSYVVLRNGSTIYTASSTTVSYTDTTARAGTTYNYTVKAKNAWATSPASNVVTIVGQ